MSKGVGEKGPRRRAQLGQIENSRDIFEKLLIRKRDVTMTFDINIYEKYIALQ